MNSSQKYLSKKISNSKANAEMAGILYTIDEKLAQCIPPKIWLSHELADKFYSFLGQFRRTISDLEEK